MKANTEIRNAAKMAKVHLWQIADAIGKRDNEFSRMLRKELTPGEKSRIFGIIQGLSEGEAMK